MNEIKNINEFDNLFKEVMENAIATPPSGIWENLSSQIGSSATKTISKSILAKSNGILIKSIIITAVTSAIVAAYFQFNNTSSRQSNIVADSLNEIKINTPESINTIEDKIDNESINSTEINNNPTIISQNNKVNLPEKVTPLIQSHEVKDAEIVPTDKKSENFDLEFPKNIENTNNNESSNPTISTSTINEEEFDFDKIDNSLSVIHKDTIYKFFPNVITPNNDGYNDVYRVEIKGEISFYLAIFNERMEKIFETKNKNKAWECKLPNGDDAPSGTYYVIIKYQLKNESEKIENIKLNILR